MLDRVRQIVKRSTRRMPRVHDRARQVYVRLAFSLGAPHDMDFGFFRNLSGGGLLIDVGANAGQAARSVRIFNPMLEILSFEPNRLLEPQLAATRQLLGRGFDYRMVGLGADNYTAPLFVPMTEAIAHTSWATLDAEMLAKNRALIEADLGGRFTVAEVAIEVRRFDDLGLRPVAVKLDTEGFELDVLRGMACTLQHHEPVLMIESNSKSAEVVAWLQERGYFMFGYDPQRNMLEELPDVRITSNYFALTETALAKLQGERKCRIARPAKQSPVAMA